MACSVLNGLTQLEKPVEKDLIHFLYHYVSDANIREKDSHYSMQQELHLDEFLQRLVVE